MSIPGTIGSVVVERPADVEEGFHLNAPLVFHYGHTAPSTNPQLYKLIVSRMAEVTNLKCEKQRKGQGSLYWLGVGLGVQKQVWFELIDLSQWVEFQNFVFLHRVLRRIKFFFTMQYIDFNCIVFLVSISGVVINTGGWIKGGGYDSLKHAAGSFEGM